MMRIAAPVTGAMLLICGLLTPASPGRAQFTEVPSTVPVGTWQVEADLGSVSWDNRTLARDGVSERVWSAASSLITTGVAGRLDLQVGFEPYLRYSYSGPGLHQVVQGRGDAYLRAKWNFWGDETRGPALALLPYLKVPTARDGVGDGRVGGGVILPFGMPLGEELSLNAMASVDQVDDGTGHNDTLFGASAVLIRQLTSRFGVYAEAGVNLDPSKTREWSGIAGAGIIWSMTERFSWDLAGYGAFTRAAPDWTGALRIVWVW